MNDIKTKFNKEQKMNRNLSSFINFGRAIKGGKYHRGAIVASFVKLVDKDDYDSTLQPELIEHCQKLNLLEQVA